MPKSKIAITVEAALLTELDRLIAQGRFANRSQAFESAVAEKVERLAGNRLAREAAKLDRDEEKEIAEEGLSHALDVWPEY